MCGDVVLVDSKIPTMLITVLTQGVLLTQAGARTISGGNANVEDTPTQTPPTVLAVENQSLHTV